MKTWERDTIERKCGYCGQPIYPGQPLLKIQVDRLTRVIRRCAAHTGEPLPADIPLAPKERIGSKFGRLLDFFQKDGE